VGSERHDEIANHNFRWHKSATRWGHRGRFRDWQFDSYLNATLGGSTTDNHVTRANLGPVAHHLLVNESALMATPSTCKQQPQRHCTIHVPSDIGNECAWGGVWENARKDDGGNQTIRASIKRGSTTAASGTDVAFGNSQYAMSQLLTDPHAGAPWSVTGVNATELGIKITN
jgi:hypothetical protein